MKKRFAAGTAFFLIAMLAFSACGGSNAPSESSSSGVATGSVSEEPATSSVSGSSTSESEAGGTSASSADAAGTEGTAEAGGDAYAWLGLQDMPKCDYLDALTTYHYYREYTSLVMGFSTETAEAVDGINTFQKTDTTRAYSVDGKVISISDSAKNYTEYDLGSAAEEAGRNLENYRESGENWTGRRFLTTGKGAIPQYSEQFGDDAEYEYYEYDYPSSEEIGYPMIERFYMKDGDVFAVYQETSNEGEVLTSMTEVIKSMSPEIPEGIFTLPDLEGYEKLEF